MGTHLVSAWLRKELQPRAWWTDVGVDVLLAVEGPAAEWSRGEKLGVFFRRDAVASRVARLCADAGLGPGANAH